MLAQLVSTSAPNGVTKPIPVTTTRRMPNSLMRNGPPARRWAGEPFFQHGGARPPTGSALVAVDIADRVLDGRDLFGGVVRDLDPEFFLESHHELNDVEAVGAQIVDEAGVLGDLVRFDAEVFDDDLFHPVGSLAHGVSFVLALLPH